MYLHSEVKKYRGKCQKYLIIFSYYMPRKPRYYLDIVSKNIVIPRRPVKAVDPLPKIAQ